jgi:transcriptional regulator with XRE-family HTH domain
MPRRPYRDGMSEEQAQRRFARALQTARARTQLTQGDMAEALGMSETVYARYERGKAWPSLGRLRRLCDILDCPADILLGLEPADTATAPRKPPPDPPAELLAVRRLRRQLRDARPNTVRVVTWLLDVLTDHALLEPPDEDDPES